MWRGLPECYRLRGNALRRWHRCSTPCHHGSVSHPEIMQRDLGSRSREIMDCVEHRQFFAVTRDGHRIGD
jgi:hypothetical protein